LAVCHGDEQKIAVQPRGLGLGARRPACLLADGHLTALAANGASTAAAPATHGWFAVSEPPGDVR